MNNIPVEEAVEEFRNEFSTYQKDVSQNHGEDYDPRILHSDYLAYEQFCTTDLFFDILAL